MSQRIVKCIKLGKEAPGLDRPPFPGELGLQIFENVSQEAWNLWADGLMIKVINEYRLNMADDKDYQVLVDQMKAYLGLDSGIAPVEVENAERGK